MNAAECRYSKEFAKFAKNYSSGKLKNPRRLDNSGALGIENLLEKIEGVALMHIQRSLILRRDREKYDPLSQLTADVIAGHYLNFTQIFSKAEALGKMWLKEYCKKVGELNAPRTKDGAVYEVVQFIGMKLGISDAVFLRRDVESILNDLPKPDREELELRYGFQAGDAKGVAPYKELAILKGSSVSVRTDAVRRALRRLKTFFFKQGCRCKYAHHHQAVSGCNSRVERLEKELNGAHLKIQQLEHQLQQQGKG